MQVTMRVRWKGASFERKLRKHRERTTGEAGDFLADEIVRLITVTRGSYAPPVHSAPFQPPYWISRDLANSYFSKIDRRLLVATVGSNLPYARYLEQGTSIMQPRPYILRTLLTRMRALGAVMCRRMR
jgi:hypothetical protein